MQLKNTVSLGCIDYGNNNFFEIMVDPNGLICLSPHGEDDCDENPDGTYDCSGYSIREFALSIADRSDYAEIMAELSDTLKRVW